MAAFDSRSDVRLWVLRNYPGGIFRAGAVALDFLQGSNVYASIKQSTKYFPRGLIDSACCLRDLLSISHST